MRGTLWYYTAFTCKTQAQRFANAHPKTNGFGRGCEHELSGRSRLGLPSVGASAAGRRAQTHGRIPAVTP